MKDRLKLKIIRLLYPNKTVMVMYNGDIVIGNSFRITTYGGGGSGGSGGTR